MGSCCTPDNSCSTNTVEISTTTAVADATTTVYAVSGMTCGHCKTAITNSVSALDGVISVDVDVAAGKVTVVTGGEPDEAAITAAVDDAGYELTGRA